MEGTLPFPRRAIILKVDLKHTSLARLDGTFVARSTMTIQIMVKGFKKQGPAGG